MPLPPSLQEYFFPREDEAKARAAAAFARSVAAPPGVARHRRSATALPLTVGIPGGDYPSHQGSPMAPVRSQSGCGAALGGRQGTW